MQLLMNAMERNRRAAEEGEAQRARVSLANMFNVPVDQVCIFAFLYLIFISCGFGFCLWMQLNDAIVFPKSVFDFENVFFFRFDRSVLIWQNWHMPRPHHHLHLLRPPLSLHRLRHL
jgi:nitrate reductase NapE component